MLFRVLVLHWFKSRILIFSRIVQQQWEYYLFWNAETQFSATLSGPVIRIAQLSLFLINWFISQHQLGSCKSYKIKSITKNETITTLSHWISNILSGSVLLIYIHLCCLVRFIKCFVIYAFSYAICALSSVSSFTSPQLSAHQPVCHTHLHFHPAHLSLLQPLLLVAFIYLVTQCLLNSQQHIIGCKTVGKWWGGLDKLKRAGPNAWLQLWQVKPGADVCRRGNTDEQRQTVKVGE